MPNDSSAFIEAIDSMVDQRANDMAFRAIVQSSTSNSVRLRRTGQTVDDNQDYPVLSSAGTLFNGDEVLCLRVGRGLVIIGKILRP